MGWVGRNFIRVVFAALVFTLLSLWGATGMESNISTSSNEGENMLPKNLCDYAITDFEEIKPDVLALFPVGMNEEDARKQLAQFPLTEGRGRKIFEHRFPKIENGQRVVENGEVIWSENAKFLNAFVECELPYDNKNSWSFELLFDEGGVVSENNFAVSIDDENFAKRNIDLKISFLNSFNALPRAINSIAKTNYQDWDRLRDYLDASGLRVSKGSTTTAEGNNLYSVSLRSDRLESIYLNRLTPGANWVTNILFDKDGNFIRAYR